MFINIGDRVLYQNEDSDRTYLTGEIVDIWRNRKNEITGYFAVLDSGLYVHIKPDSSNWCKLPEPALVAC
ncbi:MAG: hypothetical protein JSU58_00625 [Dehalococcoidales bacterium]|nr:MAG: hypothetical protein JSU58_00625 [Dehalococcoidales bacterium]